MGIFWGWYLSISSIKKINEVISQNQTYNSMKPETDSPTVCFCYKDNVKVELVPAYKDFIGQDNKGRSTLPIGRGYWIPRKGQWSMADYDYDAQYITEVNEKCDGYLIPVIKILKVLKRKYFPKMKSYHLEVLSSEVIPDAIKIIKSYRDEISYPILIYWFFYLAKDCLFDNMVMKGSNSDSSGQYENENTLMQLKDDFNQVYEVISGMARANYLDKISCWNIMFGSPFPSGD